MFLDFLFCPFSLLFAALWSVEAAISTAFATFLNLNLSCSMLAICSILVLELFMQTVIGTRVGLELVCFRVNIGFFLGWL